MAVDGCSHPSCHKWQRSGFCRGRGGCSTVGDSRRERGTLLTWHHGCSAESIYGVHAFGHHRAACCPVKFKRSWSPSLPAASVHLPQGTEVSPSLYGPFAAWTPNERTAVLPSWPPMAFLSVPCLSLSFLRGPRLQIEIPEQIPVFSSFCHWSVLGLVGKLMCTLTCRRTEGFPSGEKTTNAPGARIEEVELVAETLDSRPST